MNVRNPVDYSAMFAALDMLMAAALPQMKLYAEIGRLVSGRLEKGAAVAAAEYLCDAYPDVSGFSPRNLRRMREFYRTYENTPKVLAEAMTIGWTQNMVILEAELTIQERAWYILAAGQFGWSKLELGRNIQEHVHETMVLDSRSDLCYSSSGVGNGNGAEKTSGAFPQNLWDTEVQRELQQQGPYSSRLQSLFPPFFGTAGRADNTPPPGKSIPAPSNRERDGMAKKLNPRPPTRGEVYMVIYDCWENCCTAFVIKYSGQAISEQAKRLQDAEKCTPTQRRFGVLAGKYVLYQGKNIDDEDGILYRNMKEF